MAVLTHEALSVGGEAPPCCDRRGQVHHGEGALSWVTLCTDPVCMARREAAWARECGESPAL